MDNNQFEAPLDDAARINQDDLEVGNPESGLILVSGATFSGKTTTLESISQSLSNNHHRKILGLKVGDNETVPGIRYMSIHGFEISGSLFSRTQDEVVTDRVRQIQWIRTWLQQVIRQDPDVIVIDNIYDNLTIQMALTLAEANCLVVASMNAYSPMDALERIHEAVAGEDGYHISNLVNTIRMSIHQELRPNHSPKRLTMKRNILVADSNLRHTLRSWV